MGITFCKSADEAPIEYEVFKEGYLNNGASFIEGTIRKYVVLSVNPCALMVFKSDAKNPKDSTAYFCLQDVEFTYNVESLVLKFKRKRGGKDSWAFLAKDETELKEWANSIEDIMSKRKSSAIKTCWTIGSNDSKHNE
jgi:hypothetical protein